MAHKARSGESNLVHIGVLHKCLATGRSKSRQDVDDAWGKSRL